MACSEVSEFEIRRLLENKREELKMQEHEMSQGQDGLPRIIAQPSRQSLSISCAICDFLKTHGFENGVEKVSFSSRPSLQEKKSLKNVDLKADSDLFRSKNPLLEKALCRMSYRHLSLSIY